MYQYLMTFRSLTRAQRALAALLSREISCKLVRSPESVSLRGCTYGLEVSEALGYRAAAALQTAGLAYDRAFLLQPGVLPREVRV